MRALAYLLVVFAVAGCTVLKQDPASKAEDFLSVFQDRINDPADGEGILALFSSGQSKESIMAAVNVLRNTEYPAVSCTAYFGRAAIMNDSAGIRVEVPARLAVDTLEVQQEYEATFTLWLKDAKDGFVISRLDAEDFYNNFLSLKSQAAWVLDEQQTLEEHRRYFRIADRLREKFDTVVFVATYGSYEFFYVANGNWDIDLKNGARMGVVDSTGEVIIPVEYSLVGNPGLVGDDIVEVYTDGPRVGYFDIRTGSMLIEPEYEWIIPYKSEGVFALARKDTIGWIDRNYNFIAGFPSREAKRYYTSLGYVPESFTYSSETQTLLEGPHESNYGSGVLFTPSYLTNILKSRYENFSMDGRSYRAYVASVDARQSFFGKVNDHLQAFLTTITSHYLEGREEFYSTNEVNLVDNEGTLLGSFAVASEDVTVRKIDSTLLEVRANWEPNEFEYGLSEYDEKFMRDFNVPQYSYYSISDGSVERFESSRTYSFTEFVKIDSSYITGTFSYYDSEEGEKTREFMGEGTLHAMRNEILALYGYTFSDPLIIQELTDKNIYNPKYTTFEEIEPQLTDIDRHNLAFLTRILGPINTDPGT